MGTCDDPNYSWTDYISIDEPNGDGDFETISNLPMGTVCPNPIAIQVSENIFESMITSIYPPGSSIYNLNSTVSCQSLLSLQANPMDLPSDPDVFGISAEPTHIDLSFGFYCSNEEQAFGQRCADFEVRYCCPKWQINECDIKGQPCGSEM